MRGSVACDRLISHLVHSNGIHGYLGPAMRNDFWPLPMLVKY